MSDIATLPTRRLEDWRYADLAALDKLWPLPVAEVIGVGEGEHYTRAIVQTSGGVTQLALNLAKGASASIHVLNGGGSYARVEITVNLDAGAAFTLGAAQIAGGEASAEIVTNVRHNAPNATSKQVVRSVAGGHASASYLGKVYVAPGADGTDGAQSVRAMLLTRTATANARPELEIHADDVKCAHGCAIGELDANGLFYLAARGLPPEFAKALMLQAFVAGALDGADALQDQAQALLEAIL